MQPKSPNHRLPSSIALQHGGVVKARRHGQNLQRRAFEAFENPIRVKHVKREKANGLQQQFLLM